MKYTGIKENEIFVGNHNVTDELNLPGIRHRLGDQALDINGEKLPIDYMLPLFIHADDHLSKLLSQGNDNSTIDTIQMDDTI